MMFTVLISAVLTVLAAGQTLSTQTPSTRVIGEVTGLVADSGHILIETDNGDAVTVVVGGSTAIRKVPPGVQDLSAATQTDFTGIGVGDRVLAIGQTSKDGKSVRARSVIVMSRADLIRKQQAEHEDWRRRGISGTVSAIDPDGKAFTIKSGSRTVRIQPGRSADYRRYAPDSIKFSDARPSAFADIQIGDLVRVLGDKSSDGSAIVAEQIVSGSFRQIAATITSLSAKAAEITIKDLATEKSLFVRVNSDSILRRLPPELAAALARRYRSSGRAALEAAPSARSAQGEDIGAVLDHLPAMPLSDLRPGDAIMLSATSGTDPVRVTALVLLAGVEPLLRASPKATWDIMSGWNLGSGEGPQ